MHEIKEIYDDRFSNRKNPLSFSQPIRFIKAGNEFFIIVNYSNELFIHGNPINENESSDDNFVYGVNGMKEQFVKINEMKNIKLIDVGYEHGVIVNEYNEIFIFGNISIRKEELQQVKSDNTLCFYKVIKNDIYSKIKKVVCGFDNIFIITEDNLLYVAGVNVYSQLGFRSDEEEVMSFTKVNTLRNVNIIDIRCGDDHTLLLDKNGNVYGCGDNTFSPLGNLGGYKTQFTKLNINFKAKQIACSSHCSIILSIENQVYVSGCKTFTKLNLPSDNIIIDRIYSSFLNPIIYLVTNDNNCYIRNEGTISLCLLKDTCKNYCNLLPFFTSHFSFIIYSDYLINDENYFNSKEINLFKGKLLINKITDVTCLFF
ncbi:hypothetical protein ABK040_014425 [Willaertia magna]